jgi:hypothetical protein
VLCRWSGDGSSFAFTRDGPHSFYFKPAASLSSLSSLGPPAAADASSTLELSCLLSPPSARYPIDPTAPWLVKKSTATAALLDGHQPMPLYTEVATASSDGWKSFWGSGAFVDLASAAGPLPTAGERRNGDFVHSSGAYYTDARAYELERRVVLSQYLTRMQSSGSTPPQETGYTRNSWYGKHHHEMRWWHQSHFALWQRPELLQRSDGWFVDMLPNATAYANFQGYAGARWPKMVGPATTAMENPTACTTGKCFDAPSVGNTTYSNSSYPLLYWTGPSGTVSTKRVLLCSSRMLTRTLATCSHRVRC